MKTKRELAEARIDKMGFDEREKAVIFYDWPEGDMHLDWLITATEKEINDWFEVVDKRGADECWDWIGARIPTGLKIDQK